MQHDYKIVTANEQLVGMFIKDLKQGASHFRYYNKRPISCIQNHLLTIIMIDQCESPMAYGHLEKENNILWLGIAVADVHLNRGIGKIMMKQLINFAISINEKTISLSVDEDNYIAQKFYSGFGFIKTMGLPGCHIFELKLI